MKLYFVIYRSSIIHILYFCKTLYFFINRVYFVTFRYFVYFVYFEEKRRAGKVGDILAGKVVWDRNFTRRLIQGDSFLLPV